MWFAKWFRRRNEEEDAYEPARVPPTAAARAPRQHAAAAFSKPKARSEGFDPYNSGAFERRNAWERVSRR